MLHSSILAVLAVVLFGSVAASESHSSVLYHRIFHSSFPDLKYLQRGSISGNPPVFQPSESLLEDLKTFSDALNSVDNPSDVLYQVALAHGDEKPQSTWDFSSVKVVRGVLAYT